MTDSMPAKRRSGKEGPIRWFYLERTSPVRPVFINFAVTDARKQYDLPEHRHDTYEIIYVERGDYRARVNGEALSLTADDVLVLKPGDSHEDSFRPGLRIYGFMFTFLKEPAAMGAPEGLSILGTVDLAEGEHTFRLRLLEPWEAQKRWALWFDAIALMPVE